MASPQVFKSARNTQVDTRLVGEEGFTVPANSSIKLDIPFSREFKQIPVVHVSLEYDEHYFALSSHVAKASTKTFTVAIQNLDMEPIKGKIMWSASTR